MLATLTDLPYEDRISHFLIGAIFGLISLYIFRLIHFWWTFKHLPKGQLLVDGKEIIFPYLTTETPFGKQYVCLEWFGDDGLVLLASVFSKEEVPMLSIPEDAGFTLLPLPAIVKIDTYVWEVPTHMASLGSTSQLPVPTGVVKRYVACKKWEEDELTYSVNFRFLAHSNGSRKKKSRRMRVLKTRDTQSPAWAPGPDYRPI